MKNILCIGDSLTYGMQSFDYVFYLQAQYKQCKFFNEGINGQTSMQLAKFSLPKICKKYTNTTMDAIVLLIGTNDVLASHANMLFVYQYASQAQHSDEFNLQAFAGRYEQIVQVLCKQFTNVPIALVSMPCLGEDAQSKLNATVATYAQQVKQVATTVPNCHYVPFFETMMQALQKQASTQEFVVSFSNIAMECTSATMLQNFALLMGWYFAAT